MLEKYSRCLYYFKTEREKQVKDLAGGNVDNIS